jgi:hypothetical protein
MEIPLQFLGPNRHMVYLIFRTLCWCSVYAFGLGTFGLSIEDLATQLRRYSLSKETALAVHHGLTLQADRNSTLRFGYSFKSLFCGLWNVSRTFW